MKTKKQRWVSQSELNHFKHGDLHKAMYGSHGADCECPDCVREQVYNTVIHPVKYTAQYGAESTPVEAEKGEVYTTTDGSIDKVPESAPTHEGGGYVVDNAERILEDTSDKRNDKDSQALKLPAAMVSLLTGYDSKKDMTHSKAMEHAKKGIEKDVSKYETKIKKNVDDLQRDNKNVYANNALKFNLTQMQSIPTEGQVFDKLFNHQEMIKDVHGIENPTAKCGGKYTMAQTGEDLFPHNRPKGHRTPPVDNFDDNGNLKVPQIDPNTGLITYPGGKTTVGATTPKGQNNGFGFTGGLEGYKAAWKDVIDLSKYKTAKDAQQATYDFLAEKAPDVLQNMWSTYGLTDLGRANADKLKASGIELSADPNDKYGRLNFNDASKLTPAQLKVLNGLAYSDNMLGIRTITPQALQYPPDTQTPPPPDTYPPTAPPFTLRNNPKSTFFEPLHWYDVASQLNGLEEGPIPVRHNPAQLDQIRLHLQNPLPTLQSGERDYNAAVNNLPANTIGYANQANLFSKKYAMDNQVLGQYENINNQIKNQEITANADIRGRQSMMDQQARENTERKYLLSKEALRQQHAKSFDELMTRLAQNRKLNREGNLLMQLFPAFNQYADYNGYQVPLRMPLGTPTVPYNVPLPNSKPSNVKPKQTIFTSPTGKKFTFTS